MPVCVSEGVGMVCRQFFAVRAREYTIFIEGENFLRNCQSDNAIVG